MTVIHKKCMAVIKGTIVTKAGKTLRTTGDWGFCTKCEIRVDHLVVKPGTYMTPMFSPEVIVK